MSVQQLQIQLQQARNQLSVDSYEVSLGELVSLYRSGDLVIDPAYQQLFRWDAAQKTRFIESILLGLPVPSVFVFQRKDGVWELIEGLHQVATVLQLTGDLRSVDGTPLPPLVLVGTRLMPALAGKSWRGSNPDPDEDPENDPHALDIHMQLTIRRGRLRVDILRNECGQEVKTSLFQRLNLNGTALGAEEARLAMIQMADAQFSPWIDRLTETRSFEACIPAAGLTSKSAQVEFSLRFLAFHHQPLREGQDLDPYLDTAAIRLGRLSAAEKDAAQGLFRWVFDTVREAFDPSHRQGRVIWPVTHFEAIAHGVAVHREAISALDPETRRDWLIREAQALNQARANCQDAASFEADGGAVARLLALGRTHFAP